MKVFTFAVAIVAFVAVGVVSARSNDEEGEMIHGDASSLVSEQWSHHNKKCGQGCGHGDWECDWIHSDCSSFHVGSHGQFKFPGYNNDPGLTCGPGWYCNDGQGVDCSNVDYACIYKGCGNGNNECDDNNQCVHYDKDDSTWKCGAPGLENEEEDNTMLRGEIVTKED